MVIRLIENREEFDFKRTAKFSLIGFVWAGPYVACCLGQINRLTKVWYHRILMDQLCLMPVNMSMVNFLKPIVDGKTIDDTYEIWKHKTPIIVQKGWCYWTPVSGRTDY